MRSTLIAASALAVAAGLALVLAPAALADSKSFNLSGFDKVRVSAAIEVVLKQGPYSIKADEPKGKFDTLRIEVRDGALIVTRENTHGDDNAAYTVVISAPNYKSISVTSASNAEGKNLSLKDVAVDVNSGASLRLSGSCGALTLGISSGARFEGEDLKCQSASVSASSGATAHGFAKTLTASASTGAGVIFHGSPTVTSNVSTGGTVKTY